MPSAISQTIGFDVGVERVYRAIADSDEHSAFTGAPAQLSTEPGGAFTTHDGAIEGRMLDIVANARIVQAWRPAGWADGVFSLVRYDFTNTESGSEITLTHSGLPEEGSEHLAEGWQERYWGPLREYLGAS